MKVLNLFGRKPSNSPTAPVVSILHPSPSRQSPESSYEEAVILFPNPKENPCRCCCELMIAVKALAILNGIMLILRIIYSAVMRNKSANKREDNFALWPVLDRFGYQCVFPVPGLLQIFSGIEMTAWLIITICFFVALFGSPTLEMELLYSNLYMWINFCCPAIPFGIIHFGISLSRSGCVASFRVWSYFLLGFAVAVIWVYFNGQVAMAYRNAIRRSGNVRIRDEVEGPSIAITSGVPEDETGKSVNSEDKKENEESVQLNMNYVE